MKTLITAAKETRESLVIPHSGIPPPGIPSDWLLVTVYINTFSACLKPSHA